MDGFLSVFENKSQNQKVLIGVGILALILVIIFLSIVLDTLKQKPQVVSVTPSPTSTAQEPNLGTIGKPTSTPTPTPGPQLKSLYSGKGYTIAYPLNWKTQVIPGTVKEQVTFLPVTNPPDSYSPSIKIRVGSYDQTDWAKEEADHSLFFKKEQAQFKGIQAEKFTGVLPPPDFKGPATKSTYTTAYLFINNNRIFLIEYVYDGKGLDTQWENNINSIINTFQFTP